MDFTVTQGSFDQNITDRKLGHEWYGWDGDIDAHEGFIREPKRLALLLAAGELAITVALAAFVIWAVTPRLDALHPLLVPALWGLLAIVGLCGLGALGALACATLTGWPLRPAEAVAHQLFLRIGWLERFAKLFAISKDRLGYSLIAIHNALAAHRQRIASNGRILCLAPRCIERSNIEEIRTIIAEYDCDFYVAPNGALARQKIVQLKPAAIIGIACERDLVTGIRDVGYRLPVLAVANKRPLGPCKGAFIDTEELREAILVFRRQLGPGQPQDEPPSAAPENQPAMS